MLIIEADMVLQGQLTIIGTVILEGRFEGTIVCSRLDVGQDGYLLGHVIAQDLVVNGQIVGTASARKVHLKNTAIVEGDLRHEQLRMDEQATLVGTSKRQQQIEMPPQFKALELRAREADDDFRSLETQSRVRRVEEAVSAKAQFDQLRARFPFQLAAS